MTPRVITAALPTLCAFVLTSLATAPANAQFYKDKTINVLINSGAGGNSDQLGRLFMRYMAQFIPGNPKMVPSNVVGAGGLVGTNYLARIVKPDGLSFGIYLINGGFAQLIGAPQLQTRYSDFELIAGISTPIVSFIRKDVSPGLSSVGDIMKAKTFWAAGYARESTHDIRIRLTLDMLGVDYKITTGYPSANEMFLAIKRNEAQFSSTSLGGYYQQFIPELEKPGIAMTVWQDPYITPGGEFRRNEAVSQIPTYVEQYQKIKGEMPTGPAWEAYFQVQNGAPLTRAIIAPKGTPKQAVDILRTAVAAAAASPEFKHDYRQLMGEPPSIVDAATGEAILKRLDSAPDSVKSFLREYVK